MHESETADTTRHARHATGAGFTLLELVATIAVATLATGATIAGFAQLERGAALLSARTRLALALEEARRRAYLRETTVTALVPVGGGAVQIASDGELPTVRSLGTRIRILQAPRNGRVRFFASGGADNGSFLIGTPAQGAIRIVINVRGEVR